MARGSGYDACALRSTDLRIECLLVRQPPRRRLCRRLRLLALRRQLQSHRRQRRRLQRRRLLRSRCLGTRECERLLKALGDGLGLRGGGRGRGGARLCRSDARVARGPLLTHRAARHARRLLRGAARAQRLRQLPLGVGLGRACALEREHADVELALQLAPVHAQDLKLLLQRRPLRHTLPPRRQRGVSIGGRVATVRVCGGSDGGRRGLAFVLNRRRPRVDQPLPFLWVEQRASRRREHDDACAERVRLRVVHDRSDAHALLDALELCARTPIGALEQFLGLLQPH